MRRGAPLTLLALPFLLVGCRYQTGDHPPERSTAASVSPSATPNATPPAEPAVFTARCSTGQLAVGLQGGRFSEPTGQHSVALVITNKSTSGCYLSGYPQIAFVDSEGHLLPFQYQTTGDQVVTSAPPGHVDLAAHGLAYVTVNKYRCDAGELVQSSELRLTLPAETASYNVALIGIGYCGPGDPGSIVHVSPVEPNFLATLQQ